MQKRLFLAFVLIFLLVFNVGATELVIDFLDVGQGDSILIYTSEGGVVLIDGGMKVAGRNVVVPHLKNKGISQIDAMIITHPHTDHIGGLIPVLKEFPVKEIYADAQVHTTHVYEELLLLIEELGIPFYMARAGMELEVLGLDRLRVLHPSDSLLSGLNNNSVVIKLEFGNFSSIFTGDIERPAEEVLVSSEYELVADLLKVAHHGSRTSSTLEFITEVNPKLGIIMVGENNSYSHPNLETLVTLSAVDAEIYRTDIHGTITVRVSEEEIEITTHKAAISLEHRLNLDKVTTQQLQKIPGIGPVIAQNIIDYRKQYGFSDIGQLINVQGIGEQTLERIYQYFYLE